MTKKKTLVLASSSIYRTELLKRLDLEFSCCSPYIDETSLLGETAPALVKRLAIMKAQAVGKRYSDALIIGSDQVAVLNDQILGKPGCHEKAVEQLSQAADKEVVFYTGLALYDSGTGKVNAIVDPFKVKFRPLTANQIEHYLCKEQPYNCACSIKSEGLGIALFEKLEGNDPNSLIGLPLIRLVAMLAAEGVDVL